jgi:uncharacterized protein (TIGR03086 family)
MDDLEALARANHEFGRVLDAVGDDQWTATTPCGEWDATALVAHINLGNRMAELLLHGADATTSIGPDARPPAGEAPATTYAATSAAQLVAFSEDGALARTVHHPAMDMTGDQLLMFRTMDLALHAWDLATSVGAETTLDPDLATSVWTRLEPIAPLLSASGMFGEPKRELAPDASPGDKLLTATGR